MHNNQMHQIVAREYQHNMSYSTALQLVIWALCLSKLNY
jgi:hypothetical protein